MRQKKLLLAISVTALLSASTTIFVFHNSAAEGLLDSLSQTIKSESTDDMAQSVDTMKKMTEIKSPMPSESMAEAMDDSVIEHALKHADTAYVCPMHPNIVQDEPGSCPICGMALVAQQVSNDSGSDADHGPPIVTIRPETIQNMGVRLTRSERTELVRTIETVGFIMYDEERVGHIHPRAAGWVEKLVIRSEGERVEKGQPLLYVYSPDMLAAQEEYLLTLTSTSSSNRRDLKQRAARRLRLLDIPQSVIDSIDKTRQTLQAVPLLAPVSGIVTMLGIREGMYIKPDMELFAISDVSSVWIQAEVFEHQSTWVDAGQSAEIRVAALPERVWQGSVDYVYPELDPVTRTLRVRLRFDNSDGALKPNMFAEAMIKASPKTSLTVPRDALIVTGNEQRVVRALGDGRFQPVVVSTGIHANGRVEVLGGIDEGDEIVVSGQFLIDSESNLQASFRRMSNPE